MKMQIKFVARDMINKAKMIFKKNLHNFCFRKWTNNIREGMDDTHMQLKLPIIFFFLECLIMYQRLKTFARSLFPI